MLLSSCATVATLTPETVFLRYRAALKLVVQFGVREFLAQHPGMAAPVAAVTDAVLQTIGTVPVDADLLQALIQHHVQETSLSAAQQEMVVDLLDVALETLRGFLLEHQIPQASVTVYVHEVLQWVADAARSHGGP
jgi:hypothetical protein